MTYTKEFYSEGGKIKTIRVSARSLCIHKGKILVEQPTDVSFYYFPGGELEFGESLIDCLSREFSEETISKVVKAEYLFVVENHFQYKGKLHHSLEHYFLVELDKYDIITSESKINHHWLPLDSIENYDIRPHVVRAAIHKGTWRTEKHLIYIPSKS
ncbi:MAG: NUDIX hydrolase [Promethearchaeota archaeon]